MKKRILSLLLCLLLIAALPNTVLAAEPAWVVDNADLISANEESALIEQILDIRDTYKMDVAIVTVWDLDGKSVQTYADDYYDDHGYGYGEDYTGVLLLIAMDTREWYISTCGEAIYALTDYSLDVLGDELVHFLSLGEYYMAFENFVNSLPKYMIAYKEGVPYDGYVQPDDYYPEYRDEIVYYESEFEPNHFVSLLIGAVVALIVILIMRSRMNSAKPQKHAVEYIKDGSYHLHTCRDMFLYSRVSKTPKPQNNGGSRGGGSSVHRSSGGRSHGGRGGRF